MIALATLGWVALGAVGLGITLFGLARSAAAGMAAAGAPKEEGDGCVVALAGLAIVACAIYGWLS